MAKKKGCSCRKGSIAGFSMDSIPVNRLAAVAAGAVGAKAINAPINSYLGKNPNSKIAQLIRGKNRIAKAVFPATKGALGVYMLKQDNEMVSDAGLGVIAVAGQELIEVLMPNLKMVSIEGVAGESYYVGNPIGNTISINLDEITGAVDELEEQHEVAGALDVDYEDNDEMALTGDYVILEEEAI